MNDRPATEYETFIFQLKKYKQEMVRTGSWLQRAKVDREDWIGGNLSWADFLAQPEVGMSVREANGLIKLFDWLYEVSVPLPELNLAIAKYASTRDITDQALVNDMIVLSLKDFKDRHHEEKTENAPQTYEYMVMKRSKETGTLSRVYDDSADKLIEEYKDKIDD